jgi:hypothetical protein
MRELFDDELLISDPALDQIADRHDANQFTMIEDREMAYAFIGHHGHAFLYRLLG